MVAAETSPLFAAATVLVSVFLAWVTAFYAWQNHEMVAEMRAARELSIRPHLHLALEPVGPGYITVRLYNVGPGVATDVDVTITFVSKDGLSDARPFRTPVLTVGGFHDLLPHSPGGAMLSIEGFGTTYREITLTGTALDAYGTSLTVNHVIADVPGWQATLFAAQVQWHEPVDEAIRDSLKELAGHTKTIAAELAKPGDARDLRIFISRHRRNRRRERFEKLPGGARVAHLWDRGRAAIRRL